MPDDFATIGAPAVEADGRHGPLWRWYLLLASPFLLCLTVLLVTGWTMPVFWGSDEPDVHWPLTLWFAERLPRFDPDYALSATTPLMQLLGACVVRLVGPHLALMRALNTAFSVVGVLALFDSLRRSRRHRTGTAALLSGVLLTSCYFFGYAFRWLTDDPALTFAILALAQLFQFADPARPGRLRTFLFGCLWLAGAILTRQNYAFLCLPFGLTLLTSGLPPRTVAAGVAGMTLAVLPFGALVLAWHGLVPPDMHTRHTASLVKIYPVTLPLMLLGFYTPFFAGAELCRRAGSISRRDIFWPALAAVVALVVVWRYPLVPTGGTRDVFTHFPPAAVADVPGYFAGWIYNVAGHLPRLHGNSALFWMLLPAGGAAAAAVLQAAARSDADPGQRVASLFLFGLLISSMVNSVCAQKYYDAPVLLFLLWHARADATLDPWRRAALSALIVLFSVYFVIYVTTAHPAPARYSVIRSP